MYGDEGGESGEGGKDGVLFLRKPKVCLDSECDVWRNSCSGNFNGAATSIDSTIISTNKTVAVMQQNNNVHFAN